MLGSYWRCACCARRWYCARHRLVGRVAAFAWVRFGGVVHHMVHHAVVVCCRTLDIALALLRSVEAVLLVDVVNRVRAIFVMLNNCVAKVMLLHKSSIQTA